MEALHAAWTSTGATTPFAVFIRDYIHTCADTDIRFTEDLIKYMTDSGDFDAMYDVLCHSRRFNNAVTSWVRGVFDTKRATGFYLTAKQGIELLATYCGDADRPLSPSDLVDWFDYVVKEPDAGVLYDAIQEIGNNIEIMRTLDMKHARDLQPNRVTTRAVMDLLREFLDDIL